MARRQNAHNAETGHEWSLPNPRFETYEVNDGTVIFDGSNPLAWIHSTVTIPVDRMQ